MTDTQKMYDITSRRKRIYDPPEEGVILLITHEGGFGSVTISIASLRFAGRGYHDIAEERGVVFPYGACAVTVGKLHESKRLVAEVKGYRGEARIGVRPISGAEFQDWCNIPPTQIRRAGELRGALARVEKQRAELEDLQAKEKHYRGLAQRIRSVAHLRDRAVESGAERRRRYLRRGFESDAEGYGNRAIHAARRLDELTAGLHRLITEDPEAEGWQIVRTIEAAYPRPLHAQRAESGEEV